MQYLVNKMTGIGHKLAPIDVRRYDNETACGEGWLYDHYEVKDRPRVKVCTNCKKSKRF